MSATDPEKLAQVDENQAKKRNNEAAKAKIARLRLMKERNENYLAEQRYEEWGDEELTRELRVLGD